MSTKARRRTGNKSTGKSLIEKDLERIRRWNEGGSKKTQSSLRAKKSAASVLMSEDDDGLTTDAGVYEYGNEGTPISKHFDDAGEGYSSSEGEGDDGLAPIASKNYYHPRKYKNHKPPSYTRTVRGGRYSRTPLSQADLDLALSDSDSEGEMAGDVRRPMPSGKHYHGHEHHRHGHHGHYGHGHAHSHRHHSGGGHFAQPAMYGHHSSYHTAAALPGAPAPYYSHPNDAMVPYQGGDPRLMHRDDFGMAAPVGDPYYGSQASYGYGYAPHGMTYDHLAVARQMHELFTAPNLYDVEQVPIKWGVSRFAYRHPFTLADLPKHGDISFRELFRNNKTVQDLLASADYLGGVRISNPRASNSPVSLVMRVESRDDSKRNPHNTMEVRPADLHFPSVEKPQHLSIPKRSLASGAPQQVLIRHRSPVRPTWLSLDEFSGWNLSNLDLETKDALKPNYKEISTNHPVVRFLVSRELLDPAELANRETVQVPRDHHDRARSFMENEERQNPKISALNSLHFVLGLAHGNPTAAGVPKWNDDTEIMDDTVASRRTKALAKARQNTPIIVEGILEVEHGTPIPMDEWYGEVQDANAAGNVDMGATAAADMAQQTGQPVLQPAGNIIPEHEVIPLEVAAVMNEAGAL